MSIALYHPDTIHAQDGPLSLVRFDERMGPVVASWVQDAQELFWLAPKTAPPLTAAKVIGWPGAEGCPLLLCRLGDAEPLGYAELNPMPAQPYHLWIGHCVIRPELRGIGLGRRFVDMLLHDAFVNHRALVVSLVVFPGNRVAVGCYRSNGFLAIREQVKYMPTTGRQHRMLEMRITRAQYAAIHADI